MFETILTIAIVLGAAVWFALWLRSATSGKGGCSCGTGKCQENRKEMSHAGCPGCQAKNNHP